MYGDFSGGPEVKNPPANAGDKWHRFDPCSGKIPHAEEQLSLHATTTEARSLEPVLGDKRSHFNEKPVQRNEE